MAPTDDAPINRPIEGAQKSDAPIQTENESMAGSPDTPKPSLVRWLAAMGVLLAIAMAAPFLMGFDNIIGLIIIAIGLYEAWKLNKRNPIVITGPFDLATGGPGAESGNG